MDRLKEPMQILAFVVLFVTIGINRGVGHEPI